LHLLKGIKMTGKMRWDRAHKRKPWAKTGKFREISEQRVNSIIGSAERKAGTTGSTGTPREQGLNPRALGINLRATLTNPIATKTNARALGTNPRATGKNPRAQRPPLECEVCHQRRGITLCCRVGRKRDGTLRSLFFCTIYCRDAWRNANPERPIWHERKTGSIKGGDRTRPKPTAKHKATRSE
jgi:hypothetical protein